jgi:hypothetical protein
MNRTSIFASVMAMLAALAASACGPLLDSIGGANSPASDHPALDRFDHGTWRRSSTRLVSNDELLHPVRDELGAARA